jgi:HAD superfamily hydrolase (TIGR01484 family)
MLASDLDGTLIPPQDVGDDEGIAELAAELDTDDPPVLAYVTGRHRSLALAGIEQYSLPRPDAIVCDVGTSLYLFRHGQYEADPIYAEGMRARLRGVDRWTLHQCLVDLGALELQEEEKQAEFKLSYYAPGGQAGDRIGQQARRRLEETFGPVSVVFSEDPETGRGLLDVLPPGVAKHTSLSYLIEAFGLEQGALVYAGDSGNDRAALLSGCNAIVVGNARTALKDSIRAEAAELGLASRNERAKAHYARGVLEGCRHFGLFAA